MEKIPVFDQGDPLLAVEGEGGRANDALRVYASAGIERSIRRTAIEVGKSDTLIGRWSSQYGWRARVARWDAMQAEQREGERLTTSIEHDQQLLAIEFETLMAVNREIMQRLRIRRDPALSFKNRDLLAISRDLTARLERRIWEARRQQDRSLRLRFLVLERDGFTCRYCGRKPVEHGVILHVDHIFPASKGGATTFENLITSCGDCNLGKGDVILNARREAEDEANDDTDTQARE
jgi:hypothetical protein